MDPFGSAARAGRPRGVSTARRRPRKPARCHRDGQGNAQYHVLDFRYRRQGHPETSDIPLENIKPEAHAIDDLGIDSLDFLDIVFALDKKFGIKIPLEAWTRK